MSSFLGIDDSGDPILHFTSDVKTVAQMKGAPSTTTLFHSDLPYIFVRERWRITSYTSWGSGGGGRKFALPSDLQTFKANNPSLAFLIVVEQSDGSKTILNPCLQVSSYYETNDNGFSIILVGNVTSCINGTDYQYAFTDSDTQLSNITRGNTYASSFTFRTWDSNDTSVTIFRAPFGECQIFGGNYVKGQVDAQQLTYDSSNKTGKDLLSVGNDAVAVEIVFLNVTNSVTTFDRQPNYSKQSITIANDDFSVGGLDLLDYAPLLGRGKYAASSTVTPIYGEVYGGKSPSISLTDYDIGFVSSTNVVSKNDTLVIEIPDEYDVADTLTIDFKDKFIKRGTKTIFDATALASGLRVIGTKEIDFTLDTGTIAEFANTHVTLSSTQSGTYSETPDANTLYLMSAVFNGVDILNSALVGVGDNVILAISRYHRYEDGVAYQYSIAPKFYITIASDGTVTPKVHRYSQNYINLTPLPISFGSIKVRLIALKA